MKRIKTAVVGCGSISDIYMTNLTNGKFTVMELVACSDLMVERMNASAAKFGIKAMSLDEICADPEIEMVICLTTPAAHYPIIKQALLAGKHVFSEKMIAVDLWQGKELVQIANEKGLHLGVAPDTFLGASVQTAKYIVDKGLIGKPLSCRASISRDYGIYAEFLTHLAKKGAGIGFDMGGYYLTALAAILGPVKSVAAFTATNDPDRVNTRIGAPGFGQAYDVQVPNVISATMQYANGVLGGVATALNVIAGLDRPYRGKVLINGVPTTKFGGNSLYRSNLALLPQDPQTVFVRDEVGKDLSEITEALGLTEKEGEERVARIAEKVGITHLLKKHPLDLSGGEQQKCALAKCLLSEPKILLLDEPTKGLDARSKASLSALLKELKSGGMTVLTVTHDVEFAAENADRCALFFDGEILSSDVPSRFFSENNFYTTSSSRMARRIWREDVTCAEVVAHCRASVRSERGKHE